MDETERTVVVTGPDPVENGRFDLDAQGLPGFLLDDDLALQGRAASAQHQGHGGFVDQLLVLDDIARLNSIDRHQLISHGDAGESSRRISDDTRHLRGRHRPPWYLVRCLPSSAARSPD